MKAWKVIQLGKRELVEVALAAPGPGVVSVRVHAAPVLSYLRDVLDGNVPYALPQLPFTPGTNAVGVIERVGSGVYHLQPGTRVLVDGHVVVDERVNEPAQILLGLTAMGSTRFTGIPEATRALQRDWANGTFAEVVQVPASVVTPLPAELDDRPAAELVALSKFLVPYGGLLRGGLLPGESVVVNGATGYFGAAGAVLALALGAGRVVAAGRDREGLERLREMAGSRLVGVALGGDVDADARALAEAAGGRADLALDLVGRAKDSSATRAALYALRRHGRLVLMGSVAAPLELNVGDVLANAWSVLGNFMYPPEAPARLAELVRSGQLDLSLVRVRAFPLRELEAALEDASRMRGLDMTVLTTDVSPGS